MNKINPTKLKLTFLLLFSLLPILLATGYYLMTVEGSVGGTTNKGVLIQPVLDLVALELVDGEGRPAYLSFEELTAGVDPDAYEPRPWQLLFVSTNACDEACQQRLFMLRQVHMRLGKEADRVNRAFVLAEGKDAELNPALAAQFAEQQPDLRILTADPVKLRAQLSPSARGRNPISEQFIYVADPVGNIMLYFTGENSPEEILSDIDRLLENSSLG